MSQKALTKMKMPRFTRAEFRSRRSRLAKNLAPKSACVIVSNPEMVRSNDTEFQYRQSSDMLYFTDFPEPESILVVTNVRGYPGSILFVRPKDKASEKWTGVREGASGAVKNYGVSEAYTIDKFEEVMADILDRIDNVYYKHELNPEFDKRFDKVWKANSVALHDPTDIVAKMRLLKSERELGFMRYAAEVSAMAHVEAMALCQPGLYEYQLQATLEAVFKFNGLSYPAYTSIVGGGKNATILHYVTNEDVLQDGDLVLIDAGGEYRGYAADITRTFPVNGKFSPAQLEIYNLVLEAQEAAIRAAKPGKTINQIHAVAANIMRRGLVRLGILPTSMRLKTRHAKAVREARRAKNLETLAHLGRYFMHGTSHWIGIDVHDVPNHNRIDRGRPLKPGMAFTVEPGLYFDHDDKLVPAKYRGIGVRIEDDVVITRSGCEVLTTGVPKSAHEIENLMADAKTRLVKA